MKPIDRLRGTCGAVKCVHCMHSYCSRGPQYGCGLDKANKGIATWEDTCCTEDDWLTCQYNKPEPVFEYRWYIFLYSTAVVTDDYFTDKEIVDMVHKNFTASSGWSPVAGTGRGRIE